MKHNDAIHSREIVPYKGFNFVISDEEVFRLWGKKALGIATYKPIFSPDGGYFYPDPVKDLLD